MTERTLKTTLVWLDSLGSECSADCNVTYAFHAGYAGDRTDPPEEASVEIIRIIHFEPGPGPDLPDSLLDDDDLKAECFQDWREDQIDAEEYRAEMRREEKWT